MLEPLGQQVGRLAEQPEVPLVAATLKAFAAITLSTTWKWA